MFGGMVVLMLTCVVIGILIGGVVSIGLVLGGGGGVVGAFLGGFVGSTMSKLIIWNVYWLLGSISCVFGCFGGGGVC